MTNAFPTTVADLNFRDDTVGIQSLYHSMRDLRKSTLSIHNRLRSILQDAEFVEQVRAEHSRRGRPLPLIANERCGSWYIQPDQKTGSAYFKSTDGHFGQWDFSLRRLNLQVLSIVGKYTGAIIVDSTRRGKSMPDAFSKTIPIWVATMNRVLFPDLLYSHKLQLPPMSYSLGESEISQIEARLDGFGKALSGLSLDIEGLRKDISQPMKLFWAADHFKQVDSALGDDLENKGNQLYHSVILCSASRRVRGAEMSEGQYVQGAGDDSEGWSRGLTPRLFWQHKDLLLSTSEVELEALIQSLVAKDGHWNDSTEAVLIVPTSNLYIAKRSTKGTQINLNGKNQTTTESLADWKKIGAGKDTKGEFDFTINCNTTALLPARKTSLDLGCRSGKLGSRDLREKLDTVKEFARKLLKHDPEMKILVTCETGNDLSVGVALMILCLLYNANGQVNAVTDPPTPSGKTAGCLVAESNTAPPMDKSFIRKRLAWIISSCPSANPSRSTLQSVNAFLMARPD